MSTSEPQLILFDVAAPAAPVTAGKPGEVECSECHRILRSEKSVAAGVGPGCAAKAGRVIISMRRSKSRRRRRQGAAAA